MNKEEILQQCIVENNSIVKLPDVKLDRKIYLEVAKSLELIGGKWKGGKVAGFVFPTDPTELLSDIANGEKRNLKKEFQFFGTPKELADKLIFLADIESKMSVLEPSAGQGSIINAIHHIHSNIIIDYCELMDINQKFLQKIKNVKFLSDDFLILNAKFQYDRIIANPPFSKNQDIEHILKMYSHLKKGGRLVSISSNHWKLSKNKKETAFRKWLDEVDAEIIEIERGQFKESGTEVGGSIIIINK